jgi:3-deoxy-D-manno-octulosonic-acid transferase
MSRGIGWIYQALVTLALLVAGPLLLLFRGRHYLATLGGRLGGSGGGPVDKAPVRPLWIHAVSVGEAAVAATLAPRLPASSRLLVTTITPTGQARARAGFAPFGERARVAYLPFDLGWPIGRFLDRHDPALLLLVEGDYWPLLLARLARRGVPVAVVNGRFSDRSFPRLLRFRGWVKRALLDPIDRFAVQTAADRDRLAALGVSPERIAVTGNLKFDMPEPPAAPDLDRRISRLAAGRPVLLAGSTMAGEEEAVLDAFRRAGAGGEALLVVAPRHPERFGAVAEQVERAGFELVRRSGADRERPEVLLLDSIGELAALYRSATAAFIGGTLGTTGGHNPLEASRFGVPVAAGPSMENFREIAEIYDRERAWARVDSGAALGRLWSDWLAHPEAARALGERGRELVAANRGATLRTVEFLAPLLAGIEERGIAERAGRAGEARR